MSAEIERKYTVKDQSYRQESIECKYYKQGYISIDKERTVRIRISGNNAFITLKGVTTGCTRKEFEYPIPVADAAEMLGSLCLPPIWQNTPIKHGKKKNSQFVLVFFTIKIISTRFFSLPLPLENNRPLERCRSGRSGRSRKPLYPYGYRGFESLSFRKQKA